MKLSVKYGYQINPAAEIGPGFYIGHRETVIINGNARLGTNVNIAPGTYVNFEVLSDSIVIGSTAEIIPNAEATKGDI